jgi:uncharacterized membrane protein
MPLLALIGYPLAVHALVTAGYPLPALALLTVVSGAMAAMGWRAGGAVNRAVALMNFVIAIAALASLWQQSPFALFLPPVAAYLTLAGIFAAGLRRGAVPLVVRFMRLESASPSPALEILGRRMTALWVILFLVCAAISVRLALFATLVAWSWFTNVLAFGLMALLLVVQILYRHWRFRQEPASPRRLISALRKLPARAWREWFLPGRGVMR